LRFADGKPERLAVLAEELVRLKVGVIMAMDTPSTRAAQRATGHADLRHALYMPAVVAYSHCKAFASFVHRLKIAGKPPKVIIVALMRKLVAVAQAILKSAKPFDPTLHYT
jgi:hypothetical protein